MERNWFNMAWVVKSKFQLTHNYQSYYKHEDLTNVQAHHDPPKNFSARIQIATMKNFAWWSFLKQYCELVPKSRKLSKGLIFANTTSKQMFILYVLWNVDLSNYDGSERTSYHDPKIMNFWIRHQRNENISTYRRERVRPAKAQERLNKRLTKCRRCTLPNESDCKETRKKEHKLSSNNENRDILPILWSVPAQSENQIG